MDAPNAGSRISWFCIVALFKPNRVYLFKEEVTDDDTVLVYIL